jgi:hypothetical protein
MGDGKEGRDYKDESERPETLVYEVQTDHLHLATEVVPDESHDSLQFPVLHVVVLLVDLPPAGTDQRLLQHCLLDAAADIASFRTGRVYYLTARVLASDRNVHLLHTRAALLLHTLQLCPTHQRPRHRRHFLLTHNLYNTPHTSTEGHSLFFGGCGREGAEGSYEIQMRLVDNN